jgi:hypothetical protein
VLLDVEDVTLGHTTKLREMYADQLDTTHDTQVESKMGRYRAAIEAGGDLEEITGWIAEAKAERLKHEAELRTTTRRTRMTREEIMARAIS